MSKLTSRQEKFVQELVKGKSQRQAYYVAYPNSKKWTDNAVDARACELAKNSKIITRKEELDQKAAEKACISKAELLTMLTGIVKANLVDYLESNGKIDIEKLKENRPVISEFSKTEGKYGDSVKTKLVDPLAAAEKIIKMMGWNAPEEHNVNVNPLQQLMEEIGKAGPPKNN